MIKHTQTLHHFCPRAGMITFALWNSLNLWTLSNTECSFSFDVMNVSDDSLTHENMLKSIVNALDFFSNDLAGWLWKRDAAQTDCALLCDSGWLGNEGRGLTESWSVTPSCFRDSVCPPPPSPCYHHEGQTNTLTCFLNYDCHLLPLSIYLQYQKRPQGSGASPDVSRIILQASVRLSQCQRVIKNKVFNKHRSTHWVTDTNEAPAHKLLFMFYSCSAHDQLRGASQVKGAGPHRLLSVHSFIAWVQALAWWLFAPLLRLTHWLKLCGSWLRTRYWPRRPES